MASAWGGAFGRAWGNAWGRITEAVSEVLSGGTLWKTAAKKESINVDDLSSIWAKAPEISDYL